MGGRDRSMRRWEAFLTIIDVVCTCVRTPCCCCQCTSACEVKDPYLWWRLEEAVIMGWANDTEAQEADLFDAAVHSQLGIAGERTP